MEPEQPKFFMLDEGTEDFYKFPDDWEEDEEEEIEDDVDLKKIVIVDSSAFHRNILKSHLEETGFAVSGSVGTCIEAHEVLTGTQTRFAAVDIDQTEGGNARAVQLISMRNPEVVSILTSSRMTPDQVTQMNLAGHYVLAKPYQKKAVQEVLKKAYDAELAKKKSLNAEAKKGDA